MPPYTRCFGRRSSRINVVQRTRSQGSHHRDGLAAGFVRRTSSIVAQLASRDASAQRVQHCREIDDLLENGPSHGRERAAECDDHPDDAQRHAAHRALKRMRRMRRAM